MKKTLATDPNIAIQIPVSKRVVADNFCNSIDDSGGMSTWLHGVEWKGDRKPRCSPWYDDETLIQPGFLMAARFDAPNMPEGNKEGYRLVTFSHIKHALFVMATKYTNHYANMVRQIGDATTSDVLMQLVLMGEVHYG